MIDSPIGMLYESAEEALKGKRRLEGAAKLLQEWYGPNLLPHWRAMVELKLTDLGDAVRADLERLTFQTNEEFEDILWRLHNAK